MRFYVAFLLFALLGTPAFALVGEIDNRENVNWADYPEIIALSSYSGRNSHSCTGQYIAPNIISTAYHCVENRDGIGQRYYAYKSDKSSCEVILSKHGGSSATEQTDWALFVVENPDCYNDFFQLSETKIKRNSKTQVSHAGFGWMRVWEDGEEQQIINAFSACAKVDIDQIDKTQFVSQEGRNLYLSDVLEVVGECMEERGIKRLRDEYFNLKADKSCNLWKDAGVLVSDCDMVQGDSGSTFKLGNESIGIASRVRSKFGNHYEAYATDNSDFRKGFEELKRQYPVTSAEKPKPQQATPRIDTSNLAPIKTEVAAINTVGNSQIDMPSIDWEKSLPCAIGTDNAATVQGTNAQSDEEEQARTSAELKRIEGQQAELEPVILEGLSNSDTLTDKGIFSLLGNITTYQVLSDQYEQARARETSIANKLLTAASMAASGLGGMQLASGLAEQRADADAERDMAAYLATFTCTYGDKRASGGDTNLELPAANLFELKREYVSLATGLKSRKDALGLKPGIESEELFDSAMAGIYDNEHTGKTDGTYTSLAQALSDPTGDDAAEWSAQKDAAAKKVKTGTVLGGVGVVGGAVGNMIINRD